MFFKKHPLKCPRCGSDEMHKDTDVLTRRDNKTFICHTCGTEEALIDAGYKQITWNEINFLMNKIKPKLYSDMWIVMMLKKAVYENHVLGRQTYETTEFLKYHADSIGISYNELKSMFNF